MHGTGSKSIALAQLRFKDFFHRFRLIKRSRDVSAFTKWEQSKAMPKVF